MSKQHIPCYMPKPKNDEPSSSSSKLPENCTRTPCIFCCSKPCIDYGDLRTAARAATKRMDLNCLEKNSYLDYLEKYVLNLSKADIKDIFIDHAPDKKVNPIGRMKCCPRCQPIVDRVIVDLAMLKVTVESFCSTKTALMSIIKDSEEEFDETSTDTFKRFRTHLLKAGNQDYAATITSLIPDVYLKTTPSNNSSYSGSSDSSLQTESPDSESAASTTNQSNSVVIDKNSPNIDLSRANFLTEESAPTNKDAETNSATRNCNKNESELDVLKMSIPSDLTSLFTNNEANRWIKCKIKDCNAMVLARRVEFHIESKHKDDRLCWFCPFCTQRFGKNQQFRLHLKNVHKYLCKHCYGVFHRPDDWSIHMKTLHATKTSQGVGICNRCGIRFISPDRLRDHIKLCKFDPDQPMLQVEQKPDLDPQSSKESDLKSNLSKSSEAEDKSYICRRCNFSCDTGSELYQHKRSVHANLMCNVCGARFCRPGSLWHHSKSHLKENLTLKNFSCPVCLIRFPTKNKLDAHVKWHHTGHTTNAKRIEIECDSPSSQSVPVETSEEEVVDVAKFSFAKDTKCSTVTFPPVTTINSELSNIHYELNMDSPASVKLNPDGSEEYIFYIQNDDTNKNESTLSFPPSVTESMSIIRIPNESVEANSSKTKEIEIVLENPKLSEIIEEHETHGLTADFNDHEYVYSSAITLKHHIHNVNGLGNTSINSVAIESVDKSGNNETVTVIPKVHQTIEYSSENKIDDSQSEMHKESYQFENGRDELTDVEQTAAAVGAKITATEMEKEKVSFLGSKINVDVSKAENISAENDRVVKELGTHSDSPSDSDNVFEKEEENIQMDCREAETMHTSMVEAHIEDCMESGSDSPVVEQSQDLSAEENLISISEADDMRSESSDEFEDSEDSNLTDIRCPRCDKVFPNRESMKSHMAKMLTICVMKSAMKKKRTVDINSNQAVTKPKSQENRSKRTGTLPFGFTNLKGRNSMVVKKFRCKTCGNKYDNSIQLKKHVTRRHGKNQRFKLKHCCNSCSRKFAHRSELSAHYKVVHKRFQDHH